MGDKKIEKNGVNLERLRKLIDTKTREEIATRLECDTSLVTKHYNGKREVTAEYVVKYAKYFGVSADYLLDISEYKTPMDTEEGKIIREIEDYTGLSEEAIEKLHSYASLSKHLNIRTMREQSLRTLSLINYVISSKCFKHAISDILYYLSTMQNEIDVFYDTIDRINKNEAYATEIIHEAIIYNDARLSYFEAVESLKKIVDDYTAETYRKWEKAKEKQEYISQSASRFSGLQTKKGYEISYDLTELEKEELYPLIEKIKQEVGSSFDEIEGETNAHNNEAE